MMQGSNTRALLVAVALLVLCLLGKADSDIVVGFLIGLVHTPGALDD